VGVTPTYAELYRVNYSGHLPGGEIFDHGFWMTQNAPGTDADALAAAGDWLTAVLNSPALSVGATDVRHLFDAGIGWDRITVREYNSSTGLPLSPPLIGSIAVVGAGLSLMPPQDSIVQSLWNGRTIGKRKYNRFFWPPMETSVLNTNGRVFGGLPGDLNLAMLAGQAALQARTPLCSMAYYGSVDHTVVGLHEAQCDDVVDTHRSRRNQLVPVRTHTAF
jgi:hypothetical protein